MNKQDRMCIERFRIEIDNLGSSWDANTQSINALRDEVHELQPRYDEIVKLLKKKGVNPIRSFDDLTVKEMEEYIEKLNKFDLKKLKGYFPEEPRVTEEPLKFVKAKEITSGPVFNRRNTDNRDETLASRERRFKPKILSYFGFGRLKVEL